MDLTGKKVKCHKDTGLGDNEYVVIGTRVQVQIEHEKWGICFLNTEDVDVVTEDEG